MNLRTSRETDLDWLVLILHFGVSNNSRVAERHPADPSGKTVVTVTNFLFPSAAEFICVMLVTSFIFSRFKIFQNGYSEKKKTVKSSQKYHKNMLMIPQNSLNILINPLIFVRSNLKACSGTYECRKYSGTPLYGHPLNMDTRILRTVSFFPIHIFSLKFNPLSGNTDTSYYGQGTLFCVPSDKLLYIVNPALRALFIYVLSIFNLSAESQIKSVSTKKSHGLSQMIPFSCFKNNRVLLVRDRDK